MKEKDYEVVLEIVGNLGNTKLSRQEASVRLTGIISDKTNSFCHLANSLASSPLYSIEQKAIIAGDWIRMMYQPEQVENIVQYLGLVIVEIRNPSPLGKMGEELEEPSEGIKTLIN
ncbi:MAG: hypothetical protein FD167_2542 [bacterium]|nr:MAG: hypothetical protein FD167_2542 [bacterium]